jgi:hypothetical protein
MATWIVHLRLAENLLGMIDGLDAAQFAVGSIAPDSGIPDENWENFDPPPVVTHFQRGADKRACADMDFFREYLLPLRGAEDNAARFSFLLGYFFHLITDNLWSERVGRPTHERFAAQFDADPKFIWEVKRDWYGLDFAHVRARPESLFWRVFLHAEYPHSYLDFLSPEAIRRNLAYIKEFYQRRDEEVEAWYVQRPNLYLSETEMDGFVAEATEQLHDIYRRVWEDGAHADAPASTSYEFMKGD